MKSTFHIRLVDFSLVSFGAVCKISDVNVSVVMSMAFVKQCVKVLGLLFLFDTTGPGGTHSFG